MKKNLVCGKDFYLIKAFDDAGFVAFVPQERVVKDISNSLIDGISRGKPVIVSDVIDFSEEVKQNNFGIVIHKSTKPGKMMVDKDIYITLSENAYNYSKRHTQEQYVGTIQNTYYNRKKEEDFKQRIEIDVPKCPYS